MTRALITQMLEALGHFDDVDKTEKAITAAEECLAAPEQSNPVAKIVRNASGQISMQSPAGSAFDMSKHVGETLYTAAPQPTTPEPVNQMLLAALRKLVGTPDNPLTGWLGANGTDELFACEYCGQTHLDCTQISHPAHCPIPAAHAAIAAAGQAPQPTELTDAEIDEITAHCHDGKAYPMDAMMLPILLRRAEARAVLAAQKAKS